MSESVTPDRISEYDRYRETFPREANERRLDLFGRKFRGFSREEMFRRLELGPPGGIEVERRVAANLTADEQAELARLEAILDAWEAAAPWALDFAEIARQAGVRLDQLYREHELSDPCTAEEVAIMSSKKYHHKPERVDVEAEILAGVREVEALRGTGPRPGAPAAPEGDPAGPVEADREQGVTRS